MRSFSGHSRTPGETSIIEYEENCNFCIVAFLPANDQLACVYEANGIHNHVS